MTKKKNKKKSATKAKAFSSEKYIREKARLLPIDSCYVNSNWKQTGLANVIVVRRHNQGTYTFGCYLVDTFCRGVYDSFYSFSIDESQFREILDGIDSVYGIEEVDYEVAHNIIYGAIAFAEEVDIHPCKEFLLTQYILEEDDDKVPLIEYEFGRDGKYFLCVHSKYEASLYLPTLRKHLGDDFDFLVSDDDEEEEDEQEQKKPKTPLWLKNQGLTGEYTYERKKYEQTEELKHPWLEEMLSDMHNTSLTKGQLDKILALPHDELRHDLYQLALAEMGRNVRDEYRETYNPIISHVFILLGEVADESTLDFVLEMMRQDEDFFDYHICDSSQDVLCPTLYKLGKDNMRQIVDFLEEPSLLSSFRVELLQATIPQLFYYEKERQDEMKSYLKELLEFLLQHSDDPEYMDGNFAGFVCACVMDIHATELIPLLEELYATGNVDECICGEIEIVKRDFDDPYSTITPLVLDVYKLYQDIYNKNKRF